MTAWLYRTAPNSIMPKTIASSRGKTMANSMAAVPRVAFVIFLNFASSSLEKILTSRTVYIHPNIYRDFLAILLESFRSTSKGQHQKFSAFTAACQRRLSHDSLSAPADITRRDSLLFLPFVMYPSATTRLLRLCFLPQRSSTPTPKEHASQRKCSYTLTVA